MVQTIFHVQSCNNTVLLKQWCYFLLHILNSLRAHKGVIHLWRPQKMTNFVNIHPPPTAKINYRTTRICTSVIYFRTLPLLFRVDVMNMRMTMMMMTMMTCFVESLPDERHLASFQAENIIRNPHHCESPTRHEIWSPDVVPKLFCKILTQNDSHLSSGRFTWNSNPQICENV